MSRRSPMPPVTPLADDRVRERTSIACPLALLLVAGLLACSGDAPAPTGPGTPTVPVATVTVSPATASIDAAATQQFTATVHDASGKTLTGRSVTWTSSDTAVATVSATGLVTGVAAGSATIQATSEGKSGTAALTVAAPEPDAPVAAVLVSPGVVTLGVGATHTLAAYPRSAAGDTLTGRTVVWSSTAPTIASVDATSGKVTALAAGSAAITATSEGRTGGAFVVVATPVGSITVSEDSIVVIRGASYPLGATPQDSAGTPLTDRIVTWSSSNTAVASVGSTGLVTGVAAGTATITATSEGKSVVTEVTVTSDEIVGATITAGAYHSCGLTLSGKAYCWGSLSHAGAEPDLANSYRPIAVEGGHTFVAISAGSAHTLALTESGQAYAWGNNAYGVLGDGSGGGASGEYQYTPVPVAGGHTFKSVDAGGVVSCGITTAGEAYCWGSLVDGVVTVPTLMAGGHVFESVSVGYEYAVGLTPSGQAYGWGRNYSGEIGDGTLQWRSVPVPVAGGLTFASISAGYLHACGLTPEGAAYCWGHNVQGQLGNGTVLPDSVPVPVAGGHVFSSISAGSVHTVALKADGSAYTWGLVQGQGIGGEERDTVPVAVAAGHTFSALSAGHQHDIGISKTNGETLGWGANTARQLGDGTGYTTRTPVSAAKPSYTLSMPQTASVEQGKTLSLAVTLTPQTGGFTIHGLAPFTDDVTMSVELQPATGVTATLSPTTLSAAQPTGVLTLSVDPSANPGEWSIVVRGSAPGLADRAIGSTLTVTAPPTGGTLDLQCPTGETVLPTGYQCLTTTAADGSGVHTAGQFAGRDGIDAMHGFWVDEEAGLCIEWRSDGQARGVYKGDSFGGAGQTTDWGEWGVLVRRSGVPEGTETQWWVYTEKLDAQTALLGYDSAAKAIVGWHFQKAGACPAW